ncbi:S8 family serine peptidase [Flavobacterium croceum]|uniref:S8 family serine peptidase n=1 Tax=Flavobacterium croceum TaxID=370975 RepID=UPI0024A9F49D|nr:S8 family serine peptidase [Flavobacterium croceum]
MKYFYIFLIGISISYSQNTLERQKISNFTKKEDKIKLQNLINERQIIEDSLKLEYGLKNNLSKQELFKIKKVVNGIPLYYKEYNLGAARTINANKLYPNSSYGFSITGNGMIGGEWDGGKVRSTHQELTGRIIASDAASSLNDHSTHVAGTIIASGIQANAKGMAYQANLKCYDWNSDTSEITTFALDGYLVSNHSYGLDANALPSWMFGAYTDDSSILDNIAYTYPYYQHVKAAGNDRGDNSIAQVANKQGYDLLVGEAVSKNVITVAAVQECVLYNDSFDVQMSSFSNYGPTDDGRIKPDISAKGVNTYSCFSGSNSAYNTISGTSMATPSITGLILLLQKHYNNLHPTNYMKSASVRGLLCHTAREAGSNDGPDYGYGWGLADGLECAQLISNSLTSNIFEEKSLSNGSTYTTSVMSNSVQDLKFSISWTDPQNTPVQGIEDSRTPMLINNLDIKVLKDGITYYPWKLNPDLPSDAATNSSDNDVDNFERIDILNAQPGVYTIQVSHKGILLNGVQDYTLIASGTVGISLNTKNYEFDKSIFVYPNPTSSILNFNITENIELLSISISDISGKNVMQMPYSDSIQNKINLENLQAGVYFVKFTTKDNVSVVKKIVKE